MPSYFRYFLLFLVVVIFLFASPLIILYARGYRFDFHNLEFTKTGTISIKTIPRGAQIYLDDKLYRETSPVKIDSLKPRTYKLKVQKEGYQKWETELVVKPELVTSATHIILFPKDLNEEEIISGKVDNFSFSPDNKKLIYNIRGGEEQGIWLQEKGQDAPRQLSKIYFDEFIWSQDDKNIILIRNEKTGKRYGLVSLSELELGQPRIWDLASLLPGPIQEIQWQPGNHHKIFVLKENKLYELNLEKIQVNLLKQNVYSYLLSNWGMISVQKQGKGYFLISENYLWNADPEIVSPLPFREEYKIIPGRKKMAVIAGNDLYLIQEKLPLKIATDVSDATWSPDGKRLLYFNDHQIGVYYLKEEEKIVLTRDSRQLSNVGWWPRSQYVILTVEGKVKLIDSAYEMNTHQIIEIKNTEFPQTKIAWGKDTKSVFCLSQTDSQNQVLLEIKLIED